MAENTFSRAYQKLKTLIDYRPPVDPDPFVLDETRPDDATPGDGKEGASGDSSGRLAAMVEFSRRLAEYMEKVQSAVRTGALVPAIGSFRAELTALEKQWGELSPLVFSYASEQTSADAPISTSLKENEKKLEDIYVVPRNRDLVIRHIETGESKTPALIVYIDGLANGQKLDQFVLQPLMNNNDNIYGGDTIGQMMKTGSAQRPGAAAVHPQGTCVRNQRRRHRRHPRRDRRGHHR